MTRTWMLAAVAVCLTCAAVLLAREGVVTDNQGVAYEGDIIEKDKTVEIHRKGMQPVKVQRANVKSIEYAASVEEQFNQRMEKLKDTDSAGRVELARWAFDKKEYSLALDALDAAIGIDPNNEEALAMKRVTVRQQELHRKMAKGRAAAPEDGAATPPGAEDASGGDGGDDAAAGGDDEAMAADEGGDSAEDGGDAKAGRDADDDDDDAADGDRGSGRRAPARAGAKLRMVTPAEINRIRQMEWQKTDRVAVRFANDVKRRYLSSSEFTPQEFNKLSPAEQAFEILDNGATRLHRDVVIANDPYSMSQYRKAVERVILPGCATSACHGGTNAGDFVLHNPATKDEASYTNFILMQDYKITDEDGKERLLVDRTRAEESLLAQYGLPTRDADVPHPKAQNFRPIFKGRNDPKYRQVIEWMGQTLAPVAPNYGVDLTKPPDDDDSTTRPARGGGRARPADDEDEDADDTDGADAADEEMDDDADAAPPPPARGRPRPAAASDDAGEDAPAAAEADGADGGAAADDDDAAGDSDAGAEDEAPPARGKSGKAR